MTTKIKTLFVPITMLIYHSIKHSHYVREAGAWILSLLLCSWSLEHQTCCHSSTFSEFSKLPGAEGRNVVYCCVPSTWICTWSLIDGRMNKWMNEFSCHWYWILGSMTQVLDFSLWKVNYSISSPRISSAHEMLFIRLLLISGYKSFHCTFF